MDLGWRRRLTAEDIRLWRVRHWLTRPRAALWFGMSLGWIKAVEAETHAPRDLHGRIEAVFTRFYALEAYVKGLQAELTPDLTGPKARIALSRAIEALRAAGATAENLPPLKPQPSDMKAHLGEKGKRR